MAITRAVRRDLNSGGYDVVALPLPSIVEEELIDVVQELPLIRAVVIESPENRAVIPADPCDAFIEAVRQSIQLRVPLQCVGPDLIAEPAKVVSPPDEALIDSLGYDAWCSFALENSEETKSNIDEDMTSRYLAREAKRLDYEFEHPVMLLEIHRIPAFIKSFISNETPETFEPTLLEVRSYPINIAHLFFVLGELPFITGEYEKNRAMLFEKDLPVYEMVKRLFLESRDSYSDSKDERKHFSLTRLQQGVTFLRNLTFQENKITPNIFNMITSAKGIGGDSFALKVFKASNYYPFLPMDINDRELLSIGLSGEGSLIAKTPDGNSQPVIHLLSDTEMQWRQISLKPDREVWNSRTESYRWNMMDLCSHTPEDIFIENFNKHIHGKAVKILTDAESRSEEFTTSIKDGIDIRETLRNWHTGKVHVKETPRFHGGIDAVVIIFDETHDDHYSILTTWYAEHANESTLTFYGTDPFSNTIGPGVGECQYGGLSLIFPPKNSPDIQDFSRLKHYFHLPFNEQITIYSLHFSQELVVAYLADSAPSNFLMQKAREYKKHLLWIPLSSFSGETLRKLRKFHMLDGKQVRSWASRFIGD